MKGDERNTADEKATAEWVREQDQKLREKVDPWAGARVFEDGAVTLRTFFEWGHLPPMLQVVSRPFAALADEILTVAPSAERTAGMRKLLEAKDCIVRAALPPRA